MDDSKEIRFEKVFEWCLPRLGDNDRESLFDCQAARMRNYMRKRIVEDGWTPKYYTGNKVITADNVARFYGSCLDKMLAGNRLIEQIFCTREIFYAVPSIQASMTKYALKDLTGCLHYSDDWDFKWDVVIGMIYTMTLRLLLLHPLCTASHRLKHGQLEDAYNKRR
jgi:hypothetical protein